MFGLTREQWEANRPRLGPLEEQALLVWNFCEGWKPEAVPIAMAYLEVTNVGAVMDRLVLLRTVIAERRQAEEANGRRRPSLGSQRH